MATSEQRQALLAITCPWCQASRGEVCSMPAPGGGAKRDAEGGVRKGKRIPISTLDAGCHDARWQAAGLGTAPVLRDVVVKQHQDDAQPAGRPGRGAAAAEPQPAMAGGERPW